jgi:hypothetical protein
MIDETDVVSMIRESGKLVALKVVVVVNHCIGEATDDSFGNVYYIKKSERRVERWGYVERLRYGSPLFFG